MSLAKRWLRAKEIEVFATEERRIIEDEMIALFGVPETQEGTFSVEKDGYDIKIVGRMNRKVDSEALQELAKEHGIESFLPLLFRWTAEISLTSWRSCDKGIVNKLAPAVTTTPGRPSFSISLKGGQ